MYYYRKRSQAIEYIILANALVFFMTYAAPTLVGVLMALQPLTVFSRPWTLVTSMFLHADFSHILYNMIALFFFGTYLERMVGERSFLKVYFIGGIFASLFFTFISLALGIPDPRTIAVGASGAISAVIGALIVLQPSLTVYVYFLFPMPLWVFGLLFILLGPFMGADVAYTAHMGGILAGLAFGYYYRKKSIPEYTTVYSYGY